MRMVAAQHPGLRAGWVFPNREGDLYAGTPLRKVFSRVAPAAEVEKYLTPHGLRRTFNDLARRVANREVVQAITGHTTEAMFTHYSMVDAEEKKAVQAEVLRLVESGRKSGTFSGTPACFRTALGEKTE
jgi:integrase